MALNLQLLSRIMWSKVICSGVSINTFNQTLTNISINSLSIVGRVSTDPCIVQHSMVCLWKCVDFQLTVDWGVEQVSVEMSIECWFSVSMDIWPQFT